MSIDTKTLELLSRYIDNDLSPLERGQFEQKLAQSQELCDELSVLLKNKKAVEELAPLSKDEYFDTRLLARIHEQENIPLVLKYLKKPVVPIGVLTVFMLVFFKFNPTLLPELFDSQKKSLEAFYSENLKPFLYKANLTHDDILRFAFNKELPLNKENNQILTIGADAKGNEFLEVKSSSGSSLSMDEFTSSLKLNEKQKTEVAAILDKYSSKIAESVLAGENNSVAVNSNLWTYHNQLRAELLNYAKQSGSAAIAGLPANFSEQLPKILAPVSASVQEGREPVYYLISPDTVFTANLDVDVDKIREEIASIDPGKIVVKDPKISFNRSMAISSGEGHNKKLHIVIDSNYCKIQVPGNLTRHFPLPDMDELSSQIDSAFDKLGSFSFSMKVDEDGEQRAFAFRFKSNDDSPASVSVTVPDKKQSDSMAKSGGRMKKHTVVNADSFFNARAGKFQFPADSVFMMLQPMLRDSLKRLFDENFKNGMMMFREEMQEWFRKMEELDANGNKPPDTNTKKKKKKEVRVILNTEQI